MGLYVTKWFLYINCSLLNFNYTILVIDFILGVFTVHKIMDNSSSTASNSEVVGSVTSLKRKSDDVGWEFGELVIKDDSDKVKCKLCSRVVSGGVHRLKQHIAQVKGNVVSCPKATPMDKAKCMQALLDYKKKKEEKREKLQELQDRVNISKSSTEEVEILDSRKTSHSLGPMDNFARSISAADSLSESRKKSWQQNINDSLFKKRTNEVHTYLARWVYESAIPFNAVNNDAFQQLLEAVGQFGPGYIPPTQYQLREPLLKQAVENSKETVKKQEEEWKKSGCSIMTDAWSDRKRRSIMNLCVNCKLGTTFLSSIESSADAHTGKYIFDFVDKWIDEVGSKNVIQVVTDNASNNMAAANS